jgi:hypothetical protein
MGNVPRLSRLQVFKWVSVAVMAVRSEPIKSTALAKSGAGAQSVITRNWMSSNAHQGHKGRADTATGGKWSEKARALVTLLKGDLRII